MAALRFNTPGFAVVPCASQGAAQLMISPRVAKPKKPNWENALQRAARELAANKARLDAASSTGIPSDSTLSGRGYDTDPGGGGPQAPKQVVKRQVVSRRKKKRRR